CWPSYRWRSPRWRGCASSSTRSARAMWRPRHSLPDVCSDRRGVSLRGAARLPTSTHHLVDRVAHLPIEVTGGEFAGGDDAVGVAGSAGTDFGGEVDARDASHRIHYLLHAQALARTQVVRGLDRLARRQTLRSLGVGGGDVADVHIVAHVGAVGSVVVVAEDRRRFARDELLEHDREEVVRADVVDGVV